MRLENYKLFRISTLTTLTLALAALFTISSCADDDEPSFIPSLPAEGGNNVRHISRTGGITNTAYDWSFTYNGRRLTHAESVIRDPDNTIDYSHKYTSDLKYGNRRININNSTKEDINIVLNGSNFIERMTVNKNIYEFQYSNGHLSSWRKIIFDDSFGQAGQYKSSAVLNYENDDLKTIEYIGPDNVKVTTYFTPDVRNNLNGLLPEAIANEFGCLGFEHLYYAGLLGRPTAHLVKSISVNHPADESKCYQLDFEYSVKGNNTILCNYRTPTGEPVAVNYAY